MDFMDRTYSDEDFQKEVVFRASEREVRKRTAEKQLMHVGFTKKGATKMKVKR